MNRATIRHCHPAKALLYSRTEPVAAVYWENPQNRFRRTSVILRGSHNSCTTSALMRQSTKSVRTAVKEEGDENILGYLEPVDALAPLVAGGVIVATLTVFGLVAAPCLRNAGHRSFALWWIDEFRH